MQGRQLAHPPTFCAACGSQANHRAHCRGEGRGQRGEGEEGDPGGGRRMLCPSGLLKKDLQEEGSEVLTTSSQSSERAIRKRVPGDEPPGRSAELMEKEGKRPIFTSF